MKIFFPSPRVQKKIKNKPQRHFDKIILIIIVLIKAIVLIVTIKNVIINSTKIFEY